MTSEGAARWPLVTVAIPLYRSAGFVEVIAENVRAAEYPNLEFLISDRHLADDAAELLRVRFAGDSRVRFITARDELSWVEHYNLLLAEGGGEYFMWMPHDDSFPAGYVSALVARLETEPGAVLAFGYCDAEHPDGSRRENWPAAPAWHERQWSSRSALRLLFGCDIGVAMRGVFRRNAVMRAGLLAPAVAGSAHADRCWLFGLALLGRFAFVPETRCLKRFHGDSAHAGWGRPKPFEMPLIQTRYLNRYVRGRPERVLSIALLWAGAVAYRAIDVLNVVARREVVGRARTQAVFRRVLGAG